MMRSPAHLFLSLVLFCCCAGLGACSDDGAAQSDAGRDGALAETGTPTEAGAPTEAGGADQAAGDGSGASTPCQLACQVPADGPCADQTPEACIADCETNIAGVTAACAECLLQRTGWYGQVCSCDSAEGCCFTVFLPGEEDVTHCHELVDCTDEAYATQCLDYSVGAKLAPSCAAVCASGDGTGGL